MVAFRAFWGFSVFAKKDKNRKNVNNSQTTIKILEDVGDDKRAISENGCKIRVKTGES